MNKCQDTLFIPSNLIAALFQNIAASYRPWLHYITPVNIESKAYYVAHSIGDTALINFRISMRPIIYQIIYLTLRYSTNTVRDVLSIFNTCRDVMPAASFRQCLLQAVTSICFIWWGLQEQNSLHITTRRLDILCIQGRIQGGGGAPRRPPPKIGKNMIFWRKIVIFHTKYPKNFRASLRSAHFF